MKCRCAALAIVALAHTIAPAQGEEWTEMDGGQHWTLRDQGDLFSPDYSFFAVSQSGGAKLEIGCSKGRDMHLVFTPPEEANTQGLTRVSYAVNGAQVAYTDGGDGVASLGVVHANTESGAAADLVRAIANAWQGRITVSLLEGATQPHGTPAGLTRDFPFDEDEIGGMSEMILVTCGLL